VADDARRTIEAIWRIERAKLIAALTRLVRDLGLAEELAQDALVAALEQWPRTGAPKRPGAWLTTVAKRRALDRFRRDRLLARKHAELARELEALPEIAAEARENALDDEVGDDLLRLIFIACHPVLSRGESRADASPARRARHG
jgi:predicted RNA polymerase sigma factor